MKKKSTSLAILILFLSSGIFGQALDLKLKDKIREIVSETGHPERDNQYERILSLASNPLPYLTSLLRDDGVRNYERKAILDFIGRLQTDDAATALEKIVADDTVHSSVRNSGLISYTRNFSEKNRYRVTNFLGGLRNNSIIGKNSTDLLNKVNNGEFKKNDPNYKVNQSKGSGKPDLTNIPGAFRK
ncbi:hypothetical protein LEP1GSC047_1500 [Leptospira inadai serovar Lyme str. 10]|uniref:HEAT repeat protein n=2 Tax=Leptospira inadai serovar Lyme TaxID=293084 RepID=V6H7T2_9LEPT|nr:hypothetical protein [Leptospira inadai]EQA34806.1 hypothetical protein LEP1GSC047_1500 [Leptospira inadai serovar Lyme str. 10]PNV75379.1 hypothetical protein BES34_008990 [Leptospira inadai serovar Lyme]